MQPETGSTSTLEPRTLSGSAALHERARRVIPGGVNSPVRAMRAIDAVHPIAIARGEGAYVTDVDGNRYCDWIQSWGALPLGHAHPTVVAAATEAVRDGSSFGACTVAEAELAELMVEMVASLEQVRFVSSGTEATMSAVRVARAATGRDGIVVFEGNYHGHADQFLAAGGSGMATLGLPSSPGVPEAVVSNTVVAPYNDVDATRTLIESSGLEIAAIIVEPIAANMGCVSPTGAEGTPGAFLAELRTLCDELGSLLILDEVMTGFRVARGGAQELFGIRPDLSTFGKVVGGGFPVGAFGGHTELMELVAPAGSVYQAGTLSGNPVAMRAGIATLKALEAEDGWTRLAGLAERLADKLEERLSNLPENGRAHIARCGALMTMYQMATDAPGQLPRNFEEVQAWTDTHRFAKLHAAALRAGHLLPPSQFEAWFTSTAHDEDDVDALAEAIADAQAHQAEEGAHG